MRKYSLLVFSILLINTVTKSQTPVASFEIPDTVCIGENVYVENNSSGTVNYEWDFCTGDLIISPKANTLISSSFLKSSYSITLEKVDSQWYGFIPNVVENKLYRLDFGNSLANVPQIVDLGNFGGILNGPITIKIFYENDSWHGILVNNGSSTLLHLDFGNDIESTPTASLISGITQLSSPVSLYINQENDSLKVLVVNGDNNKIVQLDYGETVNNVPVESNFTIVGSNSLRGLSVIGNSGSYYGIVSSFGNGKVYKLVFNDGLLNAPVINEITGSGLTFSQPAETNLVQDGKEFFGFIQSRRGDLYRLAFGETMENNAAGTNLGNLNTLTSNVFGFTMAYDSSQWKGFTIDFSIGKLYKIKFEKVCAQQPTYIADSIPDALNFTQAGNYDITLKASNGVVNHQITKTITVTNQTSPTIDFMPNGGCANASFEITGSGSQEISTWNWLVDGNPFTGQSVTYSFPSPGTYTIALEVASADGCGNRLTKDITIYEPPVPKFSVPGGLLCSNGPIAFTNLTDTKGADDLITYQWDFNGEGTSTAANPSFTFASGGIKTVTLTAGIPGCAEVYDTTFTVVQGPVVNFTVPKICQGAEVQFTNLTTGNNNTAYHWDFGDGGTYTATTAVSPYYTYGMSGTYTVTLSVDNAVGCTNVFSKNVTVYASPQVAFLAEVACVGTPVQFTDQTTAGTTANIIDWRWDFGDGTGTSNIKNPAYTYSQPGTYQVKLVAYSSAGCEDSVVQEVTVSSPVTADFTYSAVCSADAAPYTLQLTDQSVAATGNWITQWLWTVNGESFTTKDVTYTFDAAGTYNITLTAIAQSACSGTITKTVAVATEPAVAFSYMGICVGETFTFTNETVSGLGDSLDYAWDFGGVGTSFEANPSFAFTETGTYTVTLTATSSASGCAYSAAQSVTVAAQPKAQFTPSATFGGAPLLVQFENQSTDATQYQWQIGDSLLTAESPAYTFTALGQYEVTLTAQNEAGCADSLTKVITVVEPVRDLVLENMRVLQADESGAWQIILTIRNAGTVSVDYFPISITVDQLLELKEEFNGHLKPGERTNHTISFTLSDRINQHVTVDYLCATLLDAPGSLPDSHLSDNRACASLTDHFNSITPFPNPVKEVLDVPLVLPAAAPVRITVEDAQGKQMRELSFSETRQGLNTFTVDMTGMAQGMYLLHIAYLDKMQTYRIMLQP